jgi:hypothetical protein
MSRHLLANVYMGMMLLAPGIRATEIGRGFRDPSVALDSPTLETAIITTLVFLPAFFRFLVGDLAWLTGAQGIAGTAFDATRPRRVWVDFALLPAQALLFGLLGALVHDVQRFLLAYMLLLVVNCVWLAYQILFGVHAAEDMFRAGRELDAQSAVRYLKTFAFWIVNNGICVGINVVGFLWVGESWTAFCIASTLINSALDLFIARDIYLGALTQLAA